MFNKFIKKSSKLIAVVLAITLSFSPLSYAADTYYVYTFADFITAISDSTATTVNIMDTFTADPGDGPLGTQIASILAINGNNYVVDAANKAGLIIGSGKETTINDLTFKNFSATSGKGGSAIHNSGNLTLTGVKFSTNTYSLGNQNTQGGSAIYNEQNATITITNGEFSFNKNTSTGQSYGGAIANAGTITNIKGNFTNNSTTNNGGAIYNTQTINKVTGNFTNNSAANSGGAIYNSKTINFVAEDSDITFNGNYVTTGNGGAIFNAITGTVGLYASADHSITFTGDTTGLPSTANNVDSIHNINILNINGDGTNTYTGTVNLYNVSDDGMKGTTNIYGGTVNFNGNYVQMDTNIEGGTTTTNGDFIQSRLNINNANLITNKILFAFGTIRVENGSIRLGENTVASSAEHPLADESFNLKNSTLNLQNNSTGTVYLKKMYLFGSNNIMLDADLAGEKMDQLKVTSASGGGNIVISDIKLLSDATEEKLSLDLFADDTTKDALKDKVTGNLSGIKYSPIYKYDALYNSETGTVDFTRKNGGDDFNPAVMAGAVASQAGGYLNQLSSYENAFEHMDTYMLTSKQQKTAQSMLNNMSASANNAVYSQPLSDESKGIWVKPYAVFEKVSLQGGPRVNNKMYGAFAGMDFDLVELRNDWNLMYSAYASYDGSHQDYDGVNIYQNGGHLGAAATWYKENFFVGLTANVGASAAEASTMDGTDNMTTLMTGAATKAGYNIELENPNLVIQPSLMMSYSFVNTFDYTNAAGVKIKSDPLHSVQIAPGVKLVGNLPHEWQPYIAAQMVWNMIDETKFTANNINLPGLSTKRYFQYGVGAQKRWGDSFSGYLQAMMRNEGRTGVAFNAGIRWAFGNN